MKRKLISLGVALVLVFTCVQAAVPVPAQAAGGTRMVSDTAELLSALADTSVAEIILEEGEYPLDEPLIIDRAVIVRGEAGRAEYTLLSGNAHEVYIP